MLSFSARCSLFGVWYVQWLALHASSISHVCHFSAHLCIGGLSEIIVLVIRVAVWPSIYLSLFLNCLLTYRKFIAVAEEWVLHFLVLYQRVDSRRKKPLVVMSPVGHLNICQFYNTYILHLDILLSFELTGEPFINGEAVPYDPKYHEEWMGTEHNWRQLWAEEKVCAKSWFSCPSR